MKSLFFINDTLENKVSYYLLACFLIALPFAHFFSEMIFIFFIIHTLIHFKSSRLAGLRKEFVWIISSVFFISLIAVSYSNYQAEGFINISRQLGILLFPVCFAVTDLDLVKYKLALLKIFAFTCTATVLYLYINAMWVIHFFHFSYTSIVSSIFINQNFSEPIGLHATYFSMYITLSISIFIYIIIRNRNYKSFKYLFCIAILIVGLVQLASRSVFISFILIIIFGIPVFLLRGKMRIRFFLLSMITFTVITITILNISSLKKRYMTDFEKDLSENTVNANFAESRMKRWVMEIGIIKQSPVIGYGTGSENYLLKENYFENKFYKSYLIGLNAHNQYLSFLIISGIIGLLVYLYVLYYGFSQAIKKKHFLLFSFLILVTIVSFAENILDVNKGVFFFSFFYSFFVIPGQKKTYL